VELYLGSDPVNGTWTRYSTVTKSECLISGQPSGQRLWVRVRAFSSAGFGPWSEIADLIVP
jgi:hypothetical protein